MSAQQQPKYAAKVPESIQTPDVVESSRLGRLEFFDGMPSDETVRKVYDQLDFSRGVETFLTGCPAASIHAFLQGMKEAGMDTFSMGIHEQLFDARTLWLTPNTTTVYCVAEINVEHGPTVMEVPPGVLGPVDDAYFRWVTDVGFTGPDRGQGGKYLFLPPGHEGEVPPGCHVVPTRSYRNWLLMRAFVIDGDLAKTAAHIKKHWRLYPLAEAASPREPHFVDLSGLQYNTIHANDFSFYEELNLGGHPNPANEGRLKTGQRRRGTRDVDAGGRGMAHRRDGQRLERREEGTGSGAGEAGVAPAAHRGRDRGPSGDGERLPQGGRRSGAAATRLGTTAAVKTGQRGVHRPRAGAKSGQ